MSARSFWLRPSSWALCWLLSLSGCSCDDHKPAATSGKAGAEGGGAGAAGDDGNGGGKLVKECTPGEAACRDGAARYCRDDGTWLRFDCDPMQGMTCDAGGCKGTCAPPQVTTS